MNNKIYEGKYIGTLAELYGNFCKIEIDEIDCWLNHNKNITLHIDNGINKIFCSEMLSNIIREHSLDAKTDELKKYSVYEFLDGGRYVTHLVENRKITDNKDFDEKKSDHEKKVKELTKNKELYITKQQRKDKIIYLTITEEKVHEIIDEIIKQVSQSGKNIFFSKEELLDAFSKLPESHNTTSRLKNNCYLGKQASIFRNFDEARFSIYFENGRLAEVRIKCDARYFI
jgi:hypothetical protein